MKEEDKIKMYSNLVYPYYLVMTWPLIILKVILKTNEEYNVQINNRM